MNLAILQPECCHPPRNETTPTIEQQPSRAMERETERQNQNFELSEAVVGEITHIGRKRKDLGTWHGDPCTSQPHRNVLQSSNLSWILLSWYRSIEREW
jgi:hypothetical protein